MLPRLLLALLPTTCKCVLLRLLLLFNHPIGAAAFNTHISPPPSSRLPTPLPQAFPIWFCGLLQLVGFIISHLLEFAITLAPAFALLSLYSYTKFLLGPVLVLMAPVMFLLYFGLMVRGRVWEAGEGTREVQKEHCLRGCGSLLVCKKRVPLACQSLRLPSLPCPGPHCAAQVDHPVAPQARHLCAVGLAVCALVDHARRVRPGG